MFCSTFSRCCFFFFSFFFPPLLSFLFPLIMRLPPPSPDVMWVLHMCEVTLQRSPACVQKDAVFTPKKKCLHSGSVICIRCLTRRSLIAIVSVHLVICCSADTSSTEFHRRSGKSRHPAPFFCLFVSMQENEEHFI